MNSRRQFRTVSQLRRPDSGYILLTLLFFVAVLAVVAASMAPLITFQIKREREEEMIHRGVQYSRAVRRYYKKFGRYPTRIEDLESTNNMRFLRKRYKDPITGDDFKLLHYGDVQMSFGAGINGAIPAGAAGQGPGAFGQQPGGFGQQPGGFGQPSGGPGGFGPNRSGGAFGGFGPGGAGGTMNQTSFGAPSGNPGPSPDQSNQNSVAGGAGTGTNSSGASGDASNGNNPSGNNQAGGSGSDSQNGNNPNNGSNSNNTNNSNGQVFGGGPIVGVVSTSEKESIRSFNKKHHYNEWQFIYDPNTDRGGLLSTPNQPPLQNTAAQPGQPGANGIPGAGGQSAPGGFGQSPFGQPGQSGFGQPTAPPPQQPPPQGSNN